MKREEVFKKEQEKWVSKISLKNSFQLEDIRLVAGLDIAYWTEGKIDFVDKNSRLPITTRYADLATHERRGELSQ